MSANIIYHARIRSRFGDLTIASTDPTDSPDGHTETVQFRPKSMSENSWKNMISGCTIELIRTTTRPVWSDDAGWHYQTSREVIQRTLLF